MELVELEESHWPQFREYREEFWAEGKYTEVTDEAAYGKWLNELADAKAGRNLMPGWVASTMYFAFTGSQIVGRITLRTELTETSKLDGGHIGYEVRPSARNRGVATQMLGLMLDRLQTQGWDRVLLTCDANNGASERVMLKRGGVFSGTCVSPRSGNVMKQYWISIKEQ